MMLQYFYTSCRQGITGSSGFQIKAKSPGLTAEDVSVINNMVGYRIPPTLDETNLATHPPALRYSYLGPGKCVLVNSQSNGPDENGRPGNFFAHAILTQPEDFATYPPIMFWRNPFWRTADPLDRTSLPEKSAFNVAPSLAFDEVWTFLSQGRRQEWFRSLLAAVVRFDTDKRPIVILDHVDHVALWIAAVTFALPGHYRPFLSFATYHHDPYQVNYRLTGTTADSRFRFSSDEYISYFVLNAEANRISEANDSTYASFVAKNFTPDLYEEKLLELFAMCSAQMPSSPLANLDAALEAITRFFLTVREGAISPSSPEGRAGLVAFLSSVEEKRTLSQDDLEQVVAIADTLFSALPNDTSPQALQTYGRALNLMKRHDRGFDNRCRPDLQAWLVTLKQDVAAAERHLKLLESVYGAALGDCASRGEFPAQLSGVLGSLPWQAYQLVWARLIPLLAGAQENKRTLETIVGQTLSLCNRMALSGSNEPGAEALSLLRTVIDGSGLSKPFLLNAAIDWQQRANGAAFLWFYYELTRNLPLAERAPFRKEAQRVQADIVLYEVTQDAKKSRIEELGSRLTAWLAHLAPDQRLRQQVIAAWLNARWTDASAAERKQISDQILINDDIAVQLEQSWKNQLVNSFMTGLSLKRLSPMLIKLYERYRRFEGLPIPQRALINGSLAITQLAFPTDSVAVIQQWLNNLDATRYQTEAAKFIEAFFGKDINIDEHANMLQAVYSVKHNGAFWDSYWTQFKNLVATPQRLRESADLLSFWFEQSADVLRERKYLAASFFLELPLIVEEVADEKSSQRAARALAESIARKEWYPLIGGSFVQQKRGLRGLFSRP